MENNIHKVGKYGTEETCKDEFISKDCARDIYNYMVVNCPINGYTYKLLENGIPVGLSFKRDGFKYDETKSHLVVPDIPTIILQENKNPDNFYVVLMGDDKYQSTGGNAIERLVKNHRCVCEEKLCYNSDIVPYVIFCAGESFIKEDGTYSDYFMNKFIQMMPYGWDINSKYSSFKKKWNRLYLKRDRFTSEEKKKILTEVAIQSYEYYRNHL